MQGYLEHLAHERRLSPHTTKGYARDIAALLELARNTPLDRLRVRPEVAIFNAFNANPVISQTNVYGPSLGNVLTILTPRTIRLGVNLDF